MPIPSSTPGIAGSMKSPRARSTGTAAACSQSTAPVRSRSTGRKHTSIQVLSAQRSSRCCHCVVVVVVIIELSECFLECVQEFHICTETEYRNRGLTKGPPPTVATPGHTFDNRKTNTPNKFQRAKSCRTKKKKSCLTDLLPVWPRCAPTPYRNV